MLESSTTFGQGHDGRVHLAGTAALVLSQRAAEAQKKFVINVQQAVKATEEADRSESREAREARETRQQQAQAKLAANRHATGEPVEAAVEPRVPGQDRSKDERAQEILDIVV